MFFSNAVKPLESVKKQPINMYLHTYYDDVHKSPWGFAGITAKINIFLRRPKQKTEYLVNSAEC